MEDVKIDRLTRSEKRLLLKIARETLEYFLNTGKKLDYDEMNLPERFLRIAGTFVSLHKGVALRGCIGRFDCDQVLYKMVQEMVIAAATRDYRFSRLKYGELKQVNIEISVLGPLTETVSVDEIILGVHGIYIRQGQKSGTLLPQVASETGWSVEEFLGHCSKDKAGLEWDSWKQAELYLFTADVFNEKEYIA